MGAVEETGGRSDVLAPEGAALAAPWRRILLAIARLGIGLGLLAYLVESHVINLHALGRLLTYWPYAAAAGILLLCDLGLMALRLSLLFRPHNLKLSLGSAFRLTLVGQFFSAFLPGGAGGDVVKLYYATRENRGRRTEIVAIVLFDRAIGLISLLILSLLIAAFFLPVIRSNPILSGLLIATAALAIHLIAGGMIYISGTPHHHPPDLGPLEILPRASHFRPALLDPTAHRHKPWTLVAPVDQDGKPTDKPRMMNVSWTGSAQVNSKLKENQVRVTGGVQAVIPEADGTVNISGKSMSCSIRLASSYPSLLKDVQTLLANLGVFCRIHLRRQAGQRSLPDGNGGNEMYA